MRELYRFFKIFVIAIFLPLLFLFLYGGCANTATPPLGGVKDTIPPILLKSLPDSNTINFPLTSGKITLQFDEYVVVKEEQKNIYLSPPQSKRPIVKIRGKGIVTTFPEPLDSGRTYTLNFGESIQDNNEGNKFYQYTFPFSTGSIIDSMMLAGTLYYAETLLPAHNVVVAAYEDSADSLLTTQLPAAVAKSDAFGYFILRNLKRAPYSIYAIEDLNYNFMYDPPAERVAFLDSIFIPSTPLEKEMAEMIAVDSKDTLLALSRPSHIELYLFKEREERQFIKEAHREEERMAFLSFTGPNPQILKFEIEELDSLSYRLERNIVKDSVVVWVTDTTLSAIDTLTLNIEYMKSDSLGALSPFEEQFVLSPPKKKREKDDKEPKGPAKPQKREDLLEFKLVIEPTLVEQTGISLIFNSPLSKMVQDSILFTEKSPRGDIEKLEFTIESDTLWSRINYLKPKSKFRAGFDYNLLLPQGVFKDIYRHTNDTIEKSFTLPKDDKLSLLTLEIEEVTGDYIVELTNVTRDKIFRSYRVNRDTTLSFPYLSKGEYSIKIVEDLNGNGVIDSGNLKLKKQPEKVRLYALPDGNSVITLPESVEILQRVNIKDIFGR
ncbi:MAG: Ig-like domain-containing protein [Bacteroidales bacterium]